VCIWRPLNGRPPKEKPKKKRPNPKKKKKTFFIVCVFSAGCMELRVFFLLQEKPREKVETAMADVCHHAFPLEYEQRRKQ
jgi:hypothetical protein